MDFIQRLILLVVLLVPAFLPNTAFADYPKTFTRYKLGYDNTYDTSYTALCTKFLNIKRSQYPSENIVQTSCKEAGVNLQGYQGGYQYYSSPITKYGTCNGVESAWGNGICTGTPPPPTCTPPLVLDPVTNTCKDPCAPKAGQPESYFSNVAGGGNSCVGGCVVKMDSGDCGTNAAGQTGCFYEGSYTGTSCSGSESGQGSTDDNAPQNPEYDCIKQGKTWGTVNGTVVCVAAGTPGSKPTTSYSPGTSSSSSTTSSNSSGSTTTSTQSTGSSSSTFNDDGTVTTTQSTTTTGSDGTQTTSQTTDTKPVADYCRDNPNVDQCKAADKGTFSGSCANGVAQVQCEGDAIACAIARQSAEANCQFFKDDPDLTNKFNEAKNDNGSTNPAATANIRTVNIPTSLDASSPYAGQCNQDVTISVAGSTVTIPFSAWCDVLNALGYLFLACAYISAAYILGSAV